MILLYQAGMRLNGIAVYLVIMLLAFISDAFSQGSVQASPYPVEIGQPDGSRLIIIGKGNKVYNHTETVDGYTIVKNADGIYEYSSLSHSGKLTPSGVKVKNISQRTTAEVNYLRTVVTHIRSASANASMLSSGSFHHYQSTAGPDRSFPASGSRKTLLILIKYPDLGNTNTSTEFLNLMNQTNYNGTGSFNDYYLANSFNQLNVTTDVFVWYTAANNYQYYGDQNGDDRARELVREAVDAAESAGVNFAQYDNDNDGTVDGVIIVHSGPGAEEGSQKQYIWSHRWVLGPYQRTYDGKLISDYMINPERRSYGMVGIGIFCHEFGHGLGLPDLYDTDDTNGDSEGVGNWCLMGAGNWLNQERTPANLSAWCKITLGWQSPAILSTPGNYSLTPANNNNISYKVNTPVLSEYFLLENRQKMGFDAYLPGEGLAIWHINSNANSNADENFKMLDLEEADGRNDLDDEVNRGDNGDLFPVSSGNQFFDNNSNPDSGTYNGNVSNISITYFTETMGSVDDVSFYFGIQEFCESLTMLTECSGAFYDGSDVHDYLDNTTCSWLIQPPGATEITLDFLEFDTEYDYDFVTIYDGATTSAPVLGSFSGSDLPPPLTSGGGSMLVVFTSDEYVTAQGWSVSYTCHACASQDISLSGGWNIISSFVMPETSDMTSVFQDIAQDIILVKNNTGRSYVPSLSINTIGNWDFTQGYKVKASSSVTLTIGCTQANPSTPISMNAGWNLVSYLRNSAMDITSALTSLGDEIIMVKSNGGQTYIPSLGINTIGNLLPGQGYQIKMAVPGTLVYPP